MTDIPYGLKFPAKILIYKEFLKYNKITGLMKELKIECETLEDVITKLVNELNTKIKCTNEENNVEINKFPEQLDYMNKLLIKGKGTLTDNKILLTGMLNLVLPQDYNIQVHKANLVVIYHPELKGYLAIEPRTGPKKLNKVLSKEKAPILDLNENEEEKEHYEREFKPDYELLKEILSRIGNIDYTNTDRPDYIN